MKMDSSKIEKYVYIFIIIVVLFKITANLLPTLTSAGGEINSTLSNTTIYGTGVSGFGALFGSGSVLWIVLLAFIFLMVLKSVIGGKK
jgi:hypothetical protein